MSAVCLWALQLKYEPLLSYNTLLQNPFVSFMVELRYCTAAHREQQQKPTRGHGSSSAFCLFCRKQTDSSIKAAAPYTLGKIAVRFVTFK